MTPCYTDVSLLSMNFLQKIRIFSKYHLWQRPSNGPSHEKELGIKPLDFNLAEYYRLLNEFKKQYYFSNLCTVIYKKKKYPILLINNFKKTQRSSNTKHVLIVSGIHGNEQAPLLAIPKLLQTNLHKEANSIHVSILAPANPIGVACFSRYNAKGQDINRDLSKFATKEARIIKSIIDNEKPDFVIGLHEGPQKGIFLYANKLVKKKTISSILKELRGNDVLLASKDYFGRELAEKGYFPIRGGILILIYFWRLLLNKTTLSTYLTDRNIPEVTTETSWLTVDITQRVYAQLVVIKTIVESLKNEKN